jgi:hypothetical protein
MLESIESDDHPEKSHEMIYVTPPVFMPDLNRSLK